MNGNLEYAKRAAALVALVLIFTVPVLVIKLWQWGWREEAVGIGAIYFVTFMLIGMIGPGGHPFR